MKSVRKSVCAWALGLAVLFGGVVPSVYAMGPVEQQSADLSLRAHVQAINNHVARLQGMLVYAQGVYEKDAAKARVIADLKKVVASQSLNGFLDLGACYLRAERIGQLIVHISCLVDNAFAHALAYSLTDALPFGINQTLLADKLAHNERALQLLSKKIEDSGLSFINRAYRSFKDLNAQYGLVNKALGVAAIIGVAALAVRYTPKSVVKKMVQLPWLNYCAQPILACKNFVGTPDFIIGEALKPTASFLLRTEQSMLSGVVTGAQSAFVQGLCEPLTKPISLFGTSLVAGALAYGNHCITRINARLAGRALARDPQEALKEEAPKLTFADVRDLSVPKGRLERIMDRMVNPMGHKGIECVLFVGLPGTGKTFLSKAMCGEMTKRIHEQDLASRVNVRYLEVAHTQVTNIGLRALIENAQERSRCVLLLDELDKLLEQHPEMTSELLQLLDGLDDVADPKKPIIIVATANSLATINDALLRSGRFGEPIYFEYPKFNERKDFFANQDGLDEASIERYALRTRGCSFKDMEMIIADARHDVAGAVDEQVFINAVDRVINERVLKISHEVQQGADACEHTAVRIAGRALVQLTYSPEHFDVATMCAVHKPSQEKGQLPQKVFGACFARFADEQDKVATSKNLIVQMCSALAEREAEKIVFGEMSFILDMRARSESVEIERMAQEFVKMRDNILGKVPAKKCSDVIEKCGETVKALLEKRHGAFDAICAALKEKHTLTKEEIETVLGACYESCGE